MTNAERFKTAEERAKAFNKFCIGKKCCSCELSTNVHVTISDCAFRWLDLDAEDEKPLPCPFCGGTDIVMQDVGGFELACQGCGFHTPAYMEKEKLISEYQRVARAVIVANESEAK